MPGLLASAPDRDGVESHPSRELDPKMPKTTYALGERSWPKDFSGPTVRRVQESLGRRASQGGWGEPPCQSSGYYSVRGVNEEEVKCEQRAFA